MSETSTTKFVVTTTSGTRFEETAASFGEVRRKFFGKFFGMEIAAIERGSLFTDEEAEEMDREKAWHRSH